MAEFTLRPATQEDFPAIRNLIHGVRINPMGLDWRHFVLAVSPSGEMLGCGQLKPHGDGSIELASIAVRAAVRGTGIARAIIEHLIAQAPRPLYLTCRSKLGPFYEKWGFHTIGLNEMPPYFRRITRLVRTMFAFERRGETLLVMMLK